jgi:DNA-binding transcriptional ArsR family regulator
MDYQVEIDWAPAYELVVSLTAYACKSVKTLELGAEWVQRVREQSGGAIASQDLPAHYKWLDILVWRCPEPRDAAGFLRWLAACPIGTLYEMLAPYVLEDSLPLPANLGAVRDEWVRALTAWDASYFRRLNPAILSGLAAEAVARRAEAGRLPPEEVVERATGGIQFIAPPGITQVLLVPQYHYRPINIYGNWRGWRIFLYPADALPPAPGGPPYALQRVTRALNDESRLRILRLLASGQHSFTQIVEEMDLAKSTVHHHLVILRAAGLVRLHDYGKGAETYALRPSALGDLATQLESYLK